jgi:hypothetical protein
MPINLDIYQTSGEKAKRQMIQKKFFGSEHTGSFSVDDWAPVEHGSPVLRRVEISHTKHLPRQ